jgi:hypothetical protein
MSKKPLFHEYEDLTNAHVVVSVELLECQPGLSDCIYNQILYDGVRKGKIRHFPYYNLFRSHVLNVFDSDKPLISKIEFKNIFLGKDTDSDYYYYGFNELITRDNYILNQSKTESHYLYKKREVKLQQNLIQAQQ